MADPDPPMSPTPPLSATSASVPVDPRARSGLPMSYERFAALIPSGDPDRIWVGPLRAYKTELHTRIEWEALIKTLKAGVVTYDNLSRPATGANRNMPPPKKRNVTPIRPFRNHLAKR